ncbi:MAG TPA: DUF222 domain-containing protein [Propionibacteriaceae bacterium]|nr:DUF222 domain-containing protein [Propionibacteriaceae bacterium]
MEAAFDGFSDSQLVAVLDRVLDALGDDRLRVPTDREQMVLLRSLVRVDARLRARQQRLAAEVEASEAAWREHGTSTTTWLSEAENLTQKEARRLIKAGEELGRFPIVGGAATRGAVLPGQAEAITSVLRDLPVDFPTQTIVEAQELMVEFAASHDSGELRRLTGHLLEVLSPETAEEMEAARLERELAEANRKRFLEFRGNGHGSVLIRGSLPIADAEPWIRIVDAYAAAQTRALDDVDPHAEYVSPSMLRADGLLAMVNHHSQQALAPVNGGDRPRVVLTLSYDRLLAQASEAGLVGAGGRLLSTGEPIAPSTIRQVLCDADILPVVLGGASEILDVGHTVRLAKGPIRAALELRDGGCVFPGCDKPPSACHAHHLTPWWAGGSTSLGNLALVCPHHHGIVEPGRDPDADRWRLRLRDDGVSEIIPPKRVDPRQRPRLHARFLTRTPCAARPTITSTAPQDDPPPLLETSPAWR